MDGVIDEDDGNGLMSIRSNKPKASTELDAVSSVLEHLAENGGLQFFMYALPGEPCQELQDSVWTIIQKMSQTLQGLYVELTLRHWVSNVHENWLKLS